MDASFIPVISQKVFEPAVKACFITVHSHPGLKQLRLYHRPDAKEYFLCDLRKQEQDDKES